MSGVFPHWSNMFVRDKFTCPSCGKCSVVDVYMSNVDSVTQDGIVLRAECYECLAFSEFRFPHWILRPLIRELSKKVPWSDPRSRCRRWGPSFTRPAVERAAWEFFPCGSVESKFVEHPILSFISRMIRSSGNPIQRRCPIIPRSGQPLAS
jgi:hypothetical protein